MYGLIDCNSFHVSCERAFQPALETKPVVVLSNNDANIIARSSEAKSLGITVEDETGAALAALHDAPGRSVESEGVNLIGGGKPGFCSSPP
jgi:DNA polymerase V